MSRLFCPSSGSLGLDTGIKQKQLRNAPSPSMMEESYSEMMHATSDFDKVVRRHHRNAYLALPLRRRPRLPPIGSPSLAATGEDTAQPSFTPQRRASVGDAVGPSDTMGGPEGCGSAETLQVAPPSGNAPSSFGEHVSFLTQSNAAECASGREGVDNDDVAVSPIRSSSPAAGTPLPNRKSSVQAAVSLDASMASERRGAAASPAPFDSVYYPHNKIRPRNYLANTLDWSIHYTAERQRHESRTDVEMMQELQAQSAFWRAKLSEAASTLRRNSPVRPGDSIAQKLEENRRATDSRFLTRVRSYMAHVEVMVEKENEEKRAAAETAAMERRRLSEWAAANPFSSGGVLDRTFATIAKDVADPKFSSLATRYYNIAYRFRQHEIDLRENYVVKLEHSTFRLGSIMTYNEFVVVYRQFNRYAAPNPYLIIAQIPKHGWMFVDKVIKTLITRKIDKNKSGKILLPDLVKHLFPAMTPAEIAIAIAAYEEHYLKFIDKKVHMFLDTIDPDKVNHFGVVFSIVDKLGNGRVTEEEFVEGMPIDAESKDDEVAIKKFLTELFTSNARRDMNEKLEYFGAPYLDLDNLASALSISRYNAYGGMIM